MSTFIAAINAATQQLELATRGMLGLMSLATQAFQLFGGEPSPTILHVVVRNTYLDACFIVTYYYS